MVYVKHMEATATLTFYVSILYRRVVAIAQYSQIYDYLCTLDKEVRGLAHMETYCSLNFVYKVSYVWSRPWTFGTFLFVLNRYMPFADLVMAFHGRPYRWCTCAVTHCRSSSNTGVSFTQCQSFLFMHLTGNQWPCRNVITRIL